MKNVSNNFKNQIKKLGREIRVRLWYGDSDTPIESNDIYYFDYSYDGAILKSVMKKLEIEIKEDLPIGTLVYPEIHLKVNGAWEEVYFGVLIIISSEKKEDTNTYRLVCYDNMIKAMIEYKDVNYTFPMTVKQYISAISTTLGLTANLPARFTNYDKIINEDVYLDAEGKSLGYTFRDVLDDLSEVTASTICVNDYGQIVIKYINNTNQTINEQSLKDINVNFGEKYGPINSVVLSRAGESDNIYRQDETSIAQNGLCEIKIVDNQILSGNDRDNFIDEIFNRLNGLEYYLNDYKSTGIIYLELCDRYNVTVDNNTYNCIMFNDEIIIEQGLEENVYTELLQQSETDYKKADSTDRKVNQAYLMVDKQEGVIQGLVSNTQSYQNLNDERVLQLEQRTNSVETRITSTEATISVMESNIQNSLENVRNTMVNININGINVSTNESAISTLINNEKFVVMNGNTPLAFIGYDSTDGVTKAEMEYLTVKTYFTVGHHRVEAFEPNYENRTGWFYIG